eukprot:TRINITY_DN105242_c0_g1_i1.p4 TRINITY_DN105242_c0_g1~~TRINITY_DN105242_c0_g1_i1.p4  ORF type:complete len:277 (+),score=24.93 TRINITY_DN105242_c0_g1_i1:1082-1912(+)
MFYEALYQLFKSEHNIYIYRKIYVLEKQRLSMLLIFVCLLFTFTLCGPFKTLPDGFVYIQDIDPTIRVNLKYFNGDNFVGRQIPCYNANKGILTKEAATALAKAQEEFNKDNYCILVYDAYRPQCAVDYFVNWLKRSNDERNKPYYYPRVNKKDFLEKGYVASKSGHSRGSTLDMTLIKCERNYLKRAIPEMRNFEGFILPFMADKSIDTGTGFDLMDEASHVINGIVTDLHNNNRVYISKVMTSVGFKVLEEEWWHFTLINEPFNNTYFNFTIDQ